MSSLIVPHRTKVQGHATVKYLWRASCSCGWWAIAGDEPKARLAARDHLESEEPFPDLLSDSAPPENFE